MSVAEMFEPLTLLHGPPMRNRFMMAPLVNQQSGHDGSASTFDQDWIRQLAWGGYALIQTGATYVEASGIAYERQLGIHSDAHVAGLTQMATSIREGARFPLCSCTTPGIALILAWAEFQPPLPA